MAAAAAGRLIVFLVLPAVLWLVPVGALSYVMRRPNGHPLLLLPALAFLVGVGAFPLVRWMTRYGQQFYWLGYLSGHLMLSAHHREAGRESRP